MPRQRMWPNNVLSRGQWIQLQILQKKSRQFQSPTSSLMPLHAIFV